MRGITRAALFVAAAVLVACGGDDPSEPTPVSAEFQLTIEGDVTGTVTGPAYFGSDVDDAGRPVFVLLLGQDSSRHLVMAGRAGAARPAAGSYVIEAPTSGGSGWNVLHLVSEGEEMLGMFVAEAGTLVITESTADVLRGTMEFDATGFLGEEEAGVRVTGTFVAAPATP